MLLFIDYSIMSIYRSHGGRGSVRQFSLPTGWYTRGCSSHAMQTETETWKIPAFTHGLRRYMISDDTVR